MDFSPLSSPKPALFYELRAVLLGARYLGYWYRFMTIFVSQLLRVRFWGQTVYN